MPEEYTYYEEQPGNFNHKLKVETNMGKEGVVDHREGWQQKEYHRFNGGVYETPEGATPGPVKRGERTKAAKPQPQPKKRAKPKQANDAALKAAVEKDIKSRNLPIKNQ